MQYFLRIIGDRDDSDPAGENCVSHTSNKNLNKSFLCLSIAKRKKTCRSRIENLKIDEIFLLFAALQPFYIG